MEDFASFTGRYVSLVSSTASEGDCFPQPGMVVKDGKLELHASALPGEQVLASMEALSTDPKVSRIAFGLDRYTRPNQGTVLPSVFTYAVIERGGGTVFGVVEYDGAGDVRPRVVEAGDFWFDQMQSNFEDVVLNMIA